MSKTYRYTDQPEAISERAERRLAARVAAEYFIMQADPERAPLSKVSLRMHEEA